MYSFSLYTIIFVEESLIQEIFQVKVGTHICVCWTRSGSKSNWPIKPDLCTQKGCLKPKRMSEGANHIVLMLLIHKKYAHNSKCRFLWSYGPIPFLPQTSKIWVFWGIACEPRIQNGCFWFKSHCFKVLNPWKKEYNPKFSLVWKLVALVCRKYSLNGTRVHNMVCDHNLGTTDPNFVFPSIFHNVLRCLIHLNHQNKGVPLNICRFLGK